MANECAGIGALPNEILITTLSFFSTCDLLPITLTCHRIHDLILRILHHRLIKAASLKDHKLILECFHPSTKLSTPYLFCEYHGTDGLNDNLEGEGSLYEGIEKTGRLGKLSGLYSHFRPLQPEDDRRPLRPLPASGWAPGPSNSVIEREAKFVCQNIYLESHELFSQLCVITNLVKVGPKRGLFKTCVTIGEGIIRIFRPWLSECSTIFKSTLSREGEDEESKKRLQWAGTRKHVGLRMKVVEREDANAPVFMRRDEDPSVSYTLQYEELVIRTTQLLLMVEQSLDQEVNHTGMLCGLDGEYLSDYYDGLDPAQSIAEFFTALLEAYGVPSLFGNQMSFGRRMISDDVMTDAWMAGDLKALLVNGRSKCTIDEITRHVYEGLDVNAFLCFNSILHFKQLYLGYVCDRFLGAEEQGRLEKATGKSDSIVR